MKSVAGKLLEEYKALNQYHTLHDKVKRIGNIVEYDDEDLGNLEFEILNPEIDDATTKYTNICSYAPCTDRTKNCYLKIDWDIDPEDFDDMMTVEDTKNWQMADVELIPV